MIILDGTFFAYRSYFIYKNNLNFNKNSKNIVYIFLKSIMALIKQDFNYFLIVFDGINSSLKRKKIIADYKANRPKMPDDLIEQISNIKFFLSALKINWVVTDNSEADDFIASTCFNIKNDINNIKIVIYSEDNDLFQLIDENTSIFLPNQKKKITLEKFLKIYDFSPQNIVDYKSIFGDKSDNINGLKGVGKKTANLWISQYKTVDKIIDNANNITPKRFENIILENKNKILLNKEVITLDKNLKVEKIWDIYKWNLLAVNKNQFNKLCDKFNFKTLRIF